MSIGDGEKCDAHVSEEEFCDYVRKRRSVLLGMAIGLTGHRADAEDLLQAALAKTYLSWDKISDRAALDGYVRRAMVNTQISWWRRRRLEEYPTDEMPDVAVGDHAADSDLHELVVRALNRLPDRMRTAVTLRYLEDKSEREIATALGISLGTVKSTVSRAMAKLREDVELGGLVCCLLWVAGRLVGGGGFLRRAARGGGFLRRAARLGVAAHGGAHCGHIAAVWRFPTPAVAHRWRPGAIDGPSVGSVGGLSPRGSSPRALHAGSLMSRGFRASIALKWLCGGGRCAAR